MRGLQRAIPGAYDVKRVESVYKRYVGCRRRFISGCMVSCSCCDRHRRLKSPSRSVYKWLHGETLPLRSIQPPQKPQPRRLARLAARRSPLRTARRPVLTSPGVALAAAPLNPTRPHRNRSLTPPQPRRRAAAGRTASRRPASSLARSRAGRRPARGTRPPQKTLSVSLPVYKRLIPPFARVYKRSVGRRLGDPLPGSFIGHAGSVRLIVTGSVGTVRSSSGHPGDLYPGPHTVRSWVRR